MNAIKQKFFARAKIMGRILYYIGAIRVHDDGSSVTAIYRWWHPVTWLLFLIMIPICAFHDATVQETIPIRVSKYFREHPDRLKWM